MNFLMKLFGLGATPKPEAGGRSPVRKHGEVFTPGMRVHIRSADSLAIRKLLQEEGPLTSEEIAKHFEISLPDVEVLLFPDEKTGLVENENGKYYLTLKGRVPSAFLT